MAIRATSCVYDQKIPNCSKKRVKLSANANPPNIHEMIHIKVIHTCIAERYFSGSCINFKTILALLLPLLRLSRIFIFFDPTKTISDNAKKPFNKIRKSNTPISIKKDKIKTND